MQSGGRCSHARHAVGTPLAAAHGAPLLANCRAHPRPPRPGHIDMWRRHGSVYKTQGRAAAAATDPYEAVREALSKHRRQELFSFAAAQLLVMGTPERAALLLRWARRRLPACLHARGDGQAGQAAARSLCCWVGGCRNRCTLSLGWLRRPAWAPVASALQGPAACRALLPGGTACVLCLAAHPPTPAAWPSPLARLPTSIPLPLCAAAARTRGRA